MKKTVQTIGLLTVVSLATFSVQSCRKRGCIDPVAVNYDAKAKIDNEACIYSSENSNNKLVKGKITQNTTWTSDYIYELKGKVVVESGVTLTIEPGTIIKGQEGSGYNASVLIIAKGAKINAQGTLSEPIIFTSVLDNIQKGQTSGTNLDITDNGKWGGLIILGEAPISAGNGDTETQIEGIPVTETYGKFGGSNPNDNSGILKYVSIRHGGSLIGAGNEINGLTLGGVGNGTQISNIEILATLDDGVEFFGGTVNIENLLVAFQGDDGIDIDMNYAGTVNNFTVIHGGLTDEGLEIDGPEGVTHTNGLFTLSNGMVRSTGGGFAADLKSRAQGTISNVTWEGYSNNNLIKIRASYSDTTTCSDKEDAYYNLSKNNPTLLLNNLTIITNQSVSNVLDVYTKSYHDASNDVCTASAQATAEAIVAGEVSVSANNSHSVDMTVFSWTWASAHGKL